MPALSGITAVRPTANTVTERQAVYGATVAAGQPLYLDAADQRWKLADSNASVSTADVRGVAITPGVNGSYGYVATGGDIILVGTTMAVGVSYVCGQTAGAIVPSSDLVTGDYVSHIGTAVTATQLRLRLDATGTQFA
jgi:hypothetical protein